MTSASPAPAFKPKARPTPAPLVLPPALRQAISQALVEKHPMLLAHVAADGQPVLSFRGSVQVLGDDRLGLWVRNPEGDFIRSIAAQPKVSLMYRNEATRATYQLQGRASVSHAPEDRQRIYEAAPAVEQAHDVHRVGVAVVIELDRVEGYAGVGPQGQIDAIHLQRGV